MSMVNRTVPADSNQSEGEFRRESAKSEWNIPEDFQDDPAYI